MLLTKLLDSTKKVMLPAPVLIVALVLKAPIVAKVEGDVRQSSAAM